MSDQESLLGSGIALILKTGAKHSGQLIHIDTSNSSITVQHGTCHAQKVTPPRNLPCDQEASLPCRSSRRLAARV